MSAHNLLHEMLQAPFAIADPGDAGTIVLDRWGAVVPLVGGAAGTQTRTLAAPTQPGLKVSLCLIYYNGYSVGVTVTGTYDGTNTYIGFNGAGDVAVLESIITASGTYRWDLTHQRGTSSVYASLPENIYVNSGATDILMLDHTPAALDILEGNNSYLKFDTTNDAEKIVAGKVIDGDGNDLATLAGAGITGGTGTICKSRVELWGGLYKTTILIDLTGLASSTTDLDIIGQGASAAHLGQITAARCGTIFAGRLTCLELPAGGADDIDLYSATQGTGVFDGGIAALTERALFTAGAALVANTSYILTAFPAANEYLYLTGGESGTAATYTAGILLIELWGA